MPADDNRFSEADRLASTFRTMLFLAGLTVAVATFSLGRGWLGVAIAALMAGMGALSDAYTFIELDVVFPMWVMVFQAGAALLLVNYMPPGVLGVCTLALAASGVLLTALAIIRSVGEWLPGERDEGATPPR